MKSIRTNEIKKGMHMQLKNGWKAVMMDNKKGNIRSMRVFGDYDEIGDMYVWKISHVEVNCEWVPVELTKAQKDAEFEITMMGF